MTEERWIIILGLPWLGSGRMTECLLAGVCLFYGMIVLVLPEADYMTPATWDIGAYGRLLSIPFLLKALLTGGGLTLNILGSDLSKQVRFAGALLGFTIWFWIGNKLLLIGRAEALTFCLVVGAAACSLRIMALALLDIPVPGARPVIVLRGQQ